MPRTVDHIVEAHRIARERQRRGQPVWAHRLDVSDLFHNEYLTFEQRRDGIAARLRKSPWTKKSEAADELAQELADTDNTDEFDSVWDAVYDEADYDRVWIKTQ